MNNKMKILIVSDTHGRLDHLEEAADKTEEFDYLIHCGDVEGQEEEVRDLALDFDAGCTIVRGNNDWGSDLNRSEILNLGPYRIFVAHGHEYGVSSGLEPLKKAAAEQSCNVAAFGHIHRPVLEEGEDLTVLNPGSLTFPRQGNRKPSYIVMEITQKGQALYTVNYLGMERERRSWFW
jgi:putative phosphoesterase